MALQDNPISLMESLGQYETQLVQIKQAIDLTKSVSEKQDLLILKKDIEELISLTKETLTSVENNKSNDATSSSQTEKDDLSDEYALFKAELAKMEEENPFENYLNVKEPPEAVKTLPQNLQDDLEALKGSKCQAPHKQQWGDESYHNALIVDIEADHQVEDINHIQVRILFVNPTEKDMIPCPYYLDGECRFTDDKCHFSHGELVPLPRIREYREPDFSSIKEGSQVLAKQKGNIWHRAKVKDILNSNKCLVQFESKGCDTVELDLHDLLPLERNSKDEDSSSCDSSDSECSVHSEHRAPDEDHFVQLALLRNPPSSALGAWEKHTKGIGSRLMANMGYVVGTGLGKHGEGRLEPVEALAYPPGKSLDACMALREAAADGESIFNANKKQRKQQNKLLRLQQRLQSTNSQRKDVFSFINSKLSSSDQAPALPSVSSQSNLASSSRKGLNVERLRLGENMKKIEKDIVKLKQSLTRHDRGSAPHNAINRRIDAAQSELNRLQNSDKLVAQEQNQRDGCKKMTVF